MNSISECQKHVEQNKLDTKEYILYMMPFIWSLGTDRMIYSNRNQNNGCL